MSEQATQLNTKQQLAVAVISGKIEGKRKYKGKTYYQVMMPAKDEFSFPSFIEFQSENTDMQVGEVLKPIKVAISGRKNSWTDKNTGEEVVNAQLWLTQVA